MLTILGKMLVRNFLNRKVDISLRTASLEYLGVVAARLRKDALTSEKVTIDRYFEYLTKIRTIDRRRMYFLGCC